MTQRCLMSRGIVTAVLVCAVVFAALAAAAGPARADSLTFIKNHNVWLANPDGSGQYQVTLDGTAGSPYESPSQADDGTIVAIRRPAGARNQLFRMTQSGRLLNPPINTPAPGPAGALDAKVSPDGQLVAYWFVTAVNDPICVFCIRAASQALLSRSDRFTGYQEVGTPNTGIKPSWISNDTILLNNSNGMQWYYRLGMPEAEEWFADYETGFSQIQLLDDSDLSRTGTRLAIVRGDNNETLVLYTTSGVPSASTAPPTARCVYSGATGGRFFNPAWSQDGQTLAWQEGDGIWTAQIDTLSDCSANPPAALRIPGAREPDFGPASVNPGPRPPCGNPGNPVGCVGPLPAPPCCAPPPGPHVDPAAVRRALGAFADRVVRRLTRIGVRGLLRKGRLTVGFDAPAAGTLSARLTAGRASASRPLVIARGRRAYEAAGKAKLVIKVTSQGTRLLRTSPRRRATLRLTFKPTGAEATSVKRQIRTRR